MGSCQNLGWKRLVDTISLIKIGFFYKKKSIFKGKTVQSGPKIITFHFRIVLYEIRTKMVHFKNFKLNDFSQLFENNVIREPKVELLKEGSCGW